MTIAFFIPGVPKTMSVGKGIRVPNKGGGFRQFQVRRHTEWAVIVGEVARQFAPPRPFEGPVSFRASFFLPRPQSAPKRVAYPLTRPDVDGLVHKLTDFWNGVFWKDDSQVVDFVARKRFATDGRTGVEIVVEEIAAP